MSNQASAKGNVTDILLAKADAKGKIGEIALLKAGYIHEGQAMTDAKCVGTFACPFDNTGGSDGLEIEINLGHEFTEFTFANSAGGDAITQADVGNLCYVAGVSTVAKTNGSSTRSVCGKIWRLKSNGSVVVRISAIG